MAPLRRIALILTVAFFMYVPLTHAGTYFEYAPDGWQSYRLAASTGATPYQVFQSAGDFELTAFSFWIDNTGSSGPVTFTLLDDQNVTLFEKTVTLGATAATAGGTRLRIELDSPISISHYQAYSIQISSTLSGLGLYYANRINILEHNLNYTTEYAMGVAKLGSEAQTYTFKFALEDPTEDNGGSADEEPIITEDPIEQSSSTEPTKTIITNARIIDITGTTAVAAWTTNVAANSTVTVRRQVSPLYIDTTASDQTLELEHTLTITGLSPNAGYFADFFSQQDADEPILTTYTVAFVTGDLTEEEQEEAAAAAQASQSSSTQATTTQTSSSTTSQTSTSSSSLPSATIGQGSGADSFSVNWNTPAEGAPNGGYRIDIFNEDNELIRQLRAPGDATSRNIAILPSGNHTVIVYADRDGVYEKVAAPTAFEAKKARSPLFWFWYLMIVIFTVIVGFAFLFSRREKTELPRLD